MPRDNLEQLFPGLRNDTAFDITSEIDPSYNCAAFAAGELEEWWDPYNPEGTWPEGIERNSGVGHFIEVFERHGFVVCDDDTIEDGYEKIAIYADASGSFGHAARQLQSGIWVSKLGELEDVQHSTPGAVESADYGRPVAFMRRQSTNN